MFKFALLMCLIIKCVFLLNVIEKLIAITTISLKTFNAKYIMNSVATLSW